MNRTTRSGFTIVELLVVISIIGLLVGILLPAINSARGRGQVTQSLSNLRNLGTAHINYASSWNGRQFTLAVDNIASYRADGASSTDPQTAAIEYHKPGAKDEWPPAIDLGWTVNMGGGGERRMGRVSFSAFFADNRPYMAPISFGLYLSEDRDPGFGWFRIPNARPFTEFLSQRFYDPVFYAPQDTMVQHYIQPGYECPYEYLSSGPAGENQLPDGIGYSSYILSPAALFSPDVMANEDTGGWRDPWSLPAGMRTPSMSQARYPELKTHMLEHHWLQNAHSPCNPAFGVTGSYDGCEPYYFNHSWESEPGALFFDGHVSPLGVRDAEQADGRHAKQEGYGLWSRDTPFGDDGYFINLGYDMANTSFHILTTDGIRGRDIFAGQ